MPKALNQPSAETTRKIESLRTALIAIERAMGVPLKTLEEKYKLSSRQLHADLDLAAQSGFVDRFRACVLDGLTPKAIAVYEAQLAMGNLDAARDILFGLGVLSKDSKGPVKERIIETLDAYREARRERLQAQRATADGDTIQ